MRRVTSGGRRTCQLSGGLGVHSRSHSAACRNRLQTKRVVARGDQRQRNRSAIAAGVHVLGFKPCAEARVINLGLALPEIWRQSTLDPKVIQLQFDCRDILWEVTPHVIGADVKPAESPTFTLSFDYHKHLLFKTG